MIKFSFIFLCGITLHSLWGKDNLLEAIAQLGPKGGGNEDVVKHWISLKQMSSADIPILLKAMNQANDLGDNWIRAALFEILENSGENALPED